MDNSTLTILTAGIAATVTIVGWNVSHYLAKKREDRTRKIEKLAARNERQIETSVARIERQLEKFYGPLLSLIEQIFNVWRVKKNY